MFARNAIQRATLRQAQRQLSTKVSEAEANYIKAKDTYEAKTIYTKSNYSLIGTDVHTAAAHDRTIVWPAATKTPWLIFPLGIAAGVANEFVGTPIPAIQDALVAPLWRPGTDFVLTKVWGTSSK
eukprot:UN00347